MGEMDGEEKSRWILMMLLNVKLIKEKNHALFAVTGRMQPMLTESEKKLVMQELGIMSEFIRECKTGR